MEITGIVHKIFDTENVTDTFRKRVVVLSYASNPMYPQLVSFEFTQDSVTAPDAVAPGQQVRVLFDLSGREWTSPTGEVKYFNTLRAWRIDPVQSKGTEAQTGEQYAEQQAQADQKVLGTSQQNTGRLKDDLPF